MKKYVFIDGEVEPGLDQFNPGVFKGDIDQLVPTGLDLDLRDQVNPCLNGSYEMRYIDFNAFHGLFE